MKNMAENNAQSISHKIHEESTISQKDQQQQKNQTTTTQKSNLPAKREVGKKKKTFKIIVIGDSGVGKTCLTYRFCSGKFPTTPTDATIGVDFREKIITLDNNEQVHTLIVRPRLLWQSAPHSTYNLRSFEEIEMGKPNGY